MAHVPLELRLSLREGSVYYFRERKLTSAKPHYYIAVNDPLSQQVLLLTVVTSKIAKVRYRRRDCLNTLVELGPADLPGVLTPPVNHRLQYHYSDWARRIFGALDAQRNQLFRERPSRSHPPILAQGDSRQLNPPKRD